MKWSAFLSSNIQMWGCLTFLLFLLWPQSYVILQADNLVCFKCAPKTDFTEIPLLARAPPLSLCLFCDFLGPCWSSIWLHSRTKDGSKWHSWNFFLIAPKLISEQMLISFHEESNLNPVSQTIRKTASQRKRTHEHLCTKAKVVCRPQMDLSMT